MADLDQHAATVQAAVMTMYGLVTGPPAAQQDAIKWLVAFEASTMAWAVQPILLRSDVSQVRYYAANGLYSQIRSNWHVLSIEQRSHVVDSMWTALANPPMDMDAKRRLCLAIAAAAIQSRQGLPLLVQRAGQIQSAALAAPHDRSLAQLWLVSELLKCASDMSDELQLSRGVRDALTEDTGMHLPAILALLQSALTAHTSAIAPAAVAQSQSPGAAAALSATLSACAGWLTASQSNIESVQGIAPGLLAGALPAMGIPSETISAAFVEFMDAFFALYTEPSLDIRFGGLATVAHACLRAGPVLVAAARHGAPGSRAGAEHAVAALVNAIEVCFLEEGWATCIAASSPVPAGINLSAFPFALCCSARSPSGHASATPTMPEQLSVGGDIVGVGVLLGDLLLQACCLPILAVQHACSHVCQSVAYTPVASRHAFYRAPFYRMETLVHASITMGAGGPWEGQGAQGEEARVSLRQDTLPDCIQDVYPALGLSYVHILLPLLHQGSAPPALAGLEQVLPSAVFTAPFHSRLEAVLYMLLAACPPSGDGLPASLFSSDEGERQGTGERTDPGGHEAVLALLLQVVKQDPANSPPELVCTVCKLLLALRGWLGTFAQEDTSLRCSTAPPFGPGVIPNSPSDTPAFALVRAADALSMIAAYLTKGMLCTRAVARGARKAGAASIASAQALVEGKAEVPEEEEEEDDEGGGRDHGLHSGEAPEGVVCAVSAVTLGKMFVSCPMLVRVQDGAALAATLAAQEAAAAQGLPIAARASLLERLLEGTRHDLSAAQWDGLCKSAVSPCVGRITAAAAAVAALPADLHAKEGLTHPALRTCITELAVLCKIFTSTPADAIMGGEGRGTKAGQEEGAWLGSSSASFPTEEEEDEQSTGPHIYQWLGEAVWPALDAVLLKAHAVQPAVSVLLYFCKQCVRLFPSLASTRLPAIISTAMQLYAAHLYPAAASAVQYALVTLLQGGRGNAGSGAAVVDPGMVGAVAGLVVETTRVTGEAEQKGGAGVEGDLTEALRQYYLLLTTCADIIPGALLQAGRPVLAMTFSLLAACFATGSRDCTKAATEYFRRLLGASSAFSMEPLPPALRILAIEACSDAARAIGPALGQSLTAEAGDDLGTACLDSFTLTVRPQGCGQAIMESLLESVQGQWVARASRLIEQAPVGTEARAMLESLQAASQPLEPSGMLSLTIEEHKGLLTHAYELAVTGGGAANWSSGGHSSSPTQHVSAAAGGVGAGARGFGGPPPRLRLLLADYSKLCQRKTTRDALLMFGLRSG